MLKSNSLAFKLSLYILTGVILIVVAILYYNYEVSKRLVLNHAGENARNLTNATVSKIENILQRTQKIPENLAYIIENTSFSEAELKRFLKMVVENNDEVFGSCIAFEPHAFFQDSDSYAPYYFKCGDSVCYKNLGTKEYDYFHQDWYRIPKESGPVWSEPYYDEGGGDIIMSTFSVPFYSLERGERRFRGIVTADISLEWLDRLIKSVRIYKSGYAFVISGKGTVISHPQKKYILNETIFKSAVELNKPELATIGNRMVHGETDFIPYRSLSLEGDCRMYFTPIPMNNWSIGVVFPDKELFAELNSLATKLLVIGGAGILSLFLLIISISGSITNPLRNLAKAAQRIGSGHFEDELPAVRSNDEIARLTESFGRMKRELREYMVNLEETTIAREKIESELKIAHDIQQGIIPRIFPPFPQRDDVDVYALLHPAKEVGGDLYDFFMIGKDLLAFSIGDVSGKGVPASLLMAITMTLFRARTSGDTGVSEIVTGINRELCRENNNLMFVTFFLGIIDLGNGRLSFCNAGHNYPYLLRAGGSFECLSVTHGPPLGLFADTAYGSGSVQLGVNEFIVLYTDGVTEAMNREGELFGEEKLEQFLENNTWDDSVKEITDGILKITDEFANGAEQSDDITLLVLQRKGKQREDAETGRQLILKNEISELTLVDDLLDSLANDWEINHDALNELKLVCEEIISNIVFYAFDDKKEHPVFFNVRLDKEMNTVVLGFEDEGKEFNPLDIPPPGDLDKSIHERNVGGLGIHLVRSLMDEFEYVRTDKRNILIVKKKLI